MQRSGIKGAHVRLMRQMGLPHPLEILRWARAQVAEAEAEAAAAIAEVAVLRDSGASSSVRLRAAEAILDRLGQRIELEDVIRRLDALETAHGAELDALLDRLAKEGDA